MKPTEAELDAGEAAFLRLLGERLRTLRMQRGTTQADLARRAGVSLRYLGQLEGGAGNVSVLLLRRVAEALGVAPEAVMAAPRPVARERLERLLDRLGPAEAEAALGLLERQFPRAGALRRERRVALVGLRGAGKSTLGRMLAAARGARFVELNRLVEEEGRMPLADLFETFGAAGVRRLERAALERVVAEDAPAVIAAGGGIVADGPAYDRLLETCFTVWVKASPEEHMRRVQEQGDTRPMRDNARAMDDLRAILASREALYARADAQVDTSGRPAEVALAELVGVVPAGRQGMPP